MRKFSIVLSIAISLAAAEFPADALAFSCSGITNFVGVVGAVKPMGQRSEIVLENSATYDVGEVGGFPTGQVSIDAVSEVVGRYVAGKERGSAEPKQAGRNRTLVLEGGAAGGAAVRPGEIIINMPPAFGGCRLAAFGVFTPEGRLRALINDGPQGSYTIGSATLESRVGKKISCKGGTCLARGAFSIDGEGALLKPGESFSPQSGPVKAIELIESSYPKDMEMAPGGKWKLRYVMRFE
ncbi:MAG TPA: hypothetical protein PLY45_02890 [bacterium]|nr:hypothetical protein [bacterium]